MGEKRLEGRVALVTGGGGEIGGAIARRVAAEGASVLVADIREDAAEPAHVAAPSALWPPSNTRVSTPASTMADLIATATPCRSSNPAKSGIVVLRR